MNAAYARLEDAIDQALAEGDPDRAEELAGAYRAAAPAGAPGALSPAWRAAWLSARVSLTAGRLTEARQRLAALLPPPADLPPALRCRVLLAVAEAAARLGRPEAPACLAAAATRLAELSAPSLLLRLHELRVRLWLGEVERLDTAVETLAADLARAGDSANLALLLCEEGRARDARGQLDRAAACWHRAAALADAADETIHADVLLQLGRLAHLRGQLQAALDRYETALSRTVLSPQRLEIRLRRLLVLLELNQEAQARFELARLAPELRRDPPEELQPLLVMVRGLLGEAGASAGAEAEGHQAARAGDLARARELYRQAHAESAGAARQARCAVALGMLALAAGDSSEARAWLNRAEALARGEELPEVLWRVLQARATLAAEHDGDDDTARTLLEAAVAVCEGQAATLRHRVDAARHGLHRGDVLPRLLASACRRGDAASLFRYQELQRGRLLLELWQAVPPDQRPRLTDDARLAQIDARLAALEREPGTEQAAVRLAELHLLRQRLLDEYLRDRSRVGDARLPASVDMEDLQRCLPAHSLYLAPVLCGDDVYLFACPAAGAPRILAAAGAAAELTARVRTWRRTLDGCLHRYRHGLFAAADHLALDRCLDDLGRGPLGDLLGQALAGDPVRRLYWSADGLLHGLPLAALRRAGRYLVESYDLVGCFGGGLLVHQARHRGRRPWWRRGVVVTEAAEVLPDAAREGDGVASTFLWPRRLHGAAAGRAALRRSLATATVVHLACHASADERDPLAAQVHLPSGESWRALDWLGEPLDGLPLVTLSACRSAEVTPLVGSEVFGLVTGLLGAGARAVLAGLWPVADREAVGLMWRLYRHLLLHELPTALALAQREELARPNASPLFWAAFCMFGDPHCLPAPAGWRRPFARWRSARHARRFAPGASGG